MASRHNIQFKHIWFQVLDQQPLIVYKEVIMWYGSTCVHAYIRVAEQALVGVSFNNQQFQNLKCVWKKSRSPDQNHDWHLDLDPLVEIRK